MSKTPDWLANAQSSIGQKEVPGPGENSFIVNLWKKIRMGGVKTESVPWCAAFVGACLENAGLLSARSGTAKAYLNWGVPIGHPCVGCIVVFERLGGGGHVGFVVGRDEKWRLLVLGGNQGDEVSIAPFELARVAGYRWPAPVPLPPAGVLPVYPMGQSPSSTRES